MQICRAYANALGTQWGRMAGAFNVLAGGGGGRAKTMGGSRVPYAQFTSPPPAHFATQPPCALYTQGPIWYTGGYGNEIHG